MCAGEAGRSRRLRQEDISGNGSTRIHQTGMEPPAAGAAATVRLVSATARGETPLLAADASELHQAG